MIVGRRFWYCSKSGQSHEGASSDFDEWHPMNLLNLVRAPDFDFWSPKDWVQFLKKSEIFEIFEDFSEKSKSEDFLKKHCVLFGIKQTNYFSLISSPDRKSYNLKIHLYFMKIFQKIKKMKYFKRTENKFWYSRTKNKILCNQSQQQEIWKDLQVPRAETRLTVYRP